MKKIILLISFTSLLFSCSNGGNASSGNSNNNNNITVTTTNPSNITSTSFDSGGSFSSNSAIWSYNYGICWSTSPNPTISDSKTVNASASQTTSNTFAAVTGVSLNPYTVYYVRAYVSFGGQSTYGNEISITTNAVPQPVLNSNLTYGSMTDIDGNVYPTITICNKTWTARNFNCSKYRNGDVIPQVQDPIQWVNLTTGAWCYYKNDSSYGPSYGKLYNWQAVADPRGIAPQGWHLPTSAEWSSLTNCMGNQSVAGCKLKEAGNLHWGLNFNDCSTNESGFTAISTGARSGQTGQFTPWASIENGTFTNSCDWYGNNCIGEIPTASSSTGCNGINCYTGYLHWGNYQGYPIRFVKD
jgi:uncharacterized protein (TIGR02145 family)